MTVLTEFRHQAFADFGKSRIKRIAFCTMVIAAVWFFADWLSGSLSVNLWHDVICLIFGIIAERIIPWGKEHAK